MVESPAPAAADALRRDRRTVVEDLLSGRTTLADLIGEARSAPVKVVVLSESVPGVGKVRSRRVLSALRIPDSTRWGELTPATARTLAEAMAEAADDGRPGPTAGGASPTAGR